MDDLTRSFEEAGPQRVRENLAFGRYSDRKIEPARAWLARQEATKADALAGRAEQRADASLGLERASLRTAQHARLIAGCSLLVAALALLHTCTH